MAESKEAICQRKSQCCLKIPLRSTEQIYLIFLVPILVACAVYVTNFAADLVVAVQHFREGNPFWGITTIALMYAPAVVYFALTVSRPDWWMTEDEKIADGVAAWFVMQLLQLAAFPLFALYRHAGVIVLVVDAIILKGEERRKTLDVAAAPAAIELYFFLQAWFQAAPQAIFQTHLLFREYPLERTHQTGKLMDEVEDRIVRKARNWWLICIFITFSVVVHTLCILVSIIMLSVQTASFQRFESQRINGRQLPWATWLKKHREQELGERDEEKPLRGETPSLTATSSVAPLIESSKIQSSEAEEQQREKPEAGLPSSGHLERQISMTPPLPPKNAQAKPPPAPIRGITTVVSLPVPEMPAPPRPDSIVRDSPPTQQDKRVTLTRESSAATRDDVATASSRKWRNLHIPKRKYPVKGLDEDDPVGKFVAFVWWFFFITSRVFSIAIFYEFYPFWLLGVVAVHYVLMIAYIFYNAKYYDVTNFFLTLWLGFVYVLSAIEYRVKFKHADSWLVAYYTFVILQNSLMTVTWFVYGEWSGFWYSYVFFAIFICMALCIMSAGVYNVLLKPKKRRVYAS